MALRRRGDEARVDRGEPGGGAEPGKGATRGGAQSKGQSDAGND